MSKRHLARFPLAFRYQTQTPTAFIHLLSSISLSRAFALSVFPSQVTCTCLLIFLISFLGFCLSPISRTRLPLLSVSHIAHSSSFSLLCFPWPVILLGFSRSFFVPRSVSLSCVLLCLFCQFNFNTRATTLQPTSRHFCVPWPWAAARRPQPLLAGSWGLI